MQTLKYPHGQQNKRNEKCLEDFEIENLCPIAEETSRWCE